MANHSGSRPADIFPNVLSVDDPESQASRQKTAYPAINHYRTGGTFGTQASTVKSNVSKH